MQFKFLVGWWILPCSIFMVHQNGNPNHFLKIRSAETRFLCWLEELKTHIIDCIQICFTTDPKKDTTIEIDGKTVVVPQGQPIHQPTFSNSSFSQSEYLVYKENQARIRYLLKLKFS